MLKTDQVARKPSGWNRKLSGQSTNCPDNLETVRTIQKLFGQSRNCPDNPKTVRTIKKLSGHSRNCPDNLETVRTIQKVYGQFKNCPDNLETVRTIQKLPERLYLSSFTRICREIVNVAHFIRKVFAVKILLSGKFLLFLTLILHGRIRN